MASDESDFIKKMIDRFGNKILSGNGKIVHVDRSNIGYRRALFDIEMLSRCDEMILTGGSTFGFIASIKAQKRPFTVEGKRSAKTCARLKFSEPARTYLGHSIF